MDGTLRQSILKYIAAISAAVGCGEAEAARGLREIPAEIVAEVVEDTEGAQWRAPDRERLLRLLAMDSRVLVRSRVAESLGALSSESPAEAASLLRDLLRDPSQRVRASAAKGLAEILRQASLVERAEIVATWVVSGAVGERVAIARALCYRTPVLITDLAIEVLASDPNPEVRRHAVQAASLHLDEDPTEYRRIALGLVSDPDRRVRHAARRLLERAV